MESNLPQKERKWKILLKKQENNLFDPKEKEIANKIQSQNKENEIHTGGLNLKNATESLSSCS